MSQKTTAIPVASPRARAKLAEATALLPMDPAAAASAARRAWTWAPLDLGFIRDVVTLIGQAGEAEMGAELLAESETLIAKHISTLPVWRPPPVGETPLERSRELYLGLMERVVCNWIYADGAIRGDKEVPFDQQQRNVGKDIPVVAHSMIGLQRLRHLRWAVETALAEDIPGDLMECGVWRGGAVALARAVLAAHDEKIRRVWAVDSFAGLPPPDPRFPQDQDTGFDFHKRPELSVGLDDVRENIARYGLLDEQVVFLKGWFHESLPTLPRLKLAVLRVDGDLYSSTTDVLEVMYPNLSPGGIVILDDYGPVVDSQRAVLHFRARHGISDVMLAVDQDAVFWRKGSGA
jgi:hypothetical protein